MQVNAVDTTVRSQFVVVIDYGLGNLFSVKRALEYIGAQVEITSNPKKILNAEHLVLPGVGTFGDGMKGLKERGLVEPIKEYVKTGKSLLGVCLGMQLLMSEGQEFGIYKGLDVIQGRTMRLKPSVKNGNFYKVPHIGWNSLFYPKDVSHRDSFANPRRSSPWDNTILGSLSEGVFMYFVHSNVIMLENSSYHLAETIYGDNVFCSVVRKGNIYGCQFHPERSGEEGLRIYRNFVFGTKKSERCLGKN